MLLQCGSGVRGRKVKVVEVSAAVAHRPQKVTLSQPVCVRGARAVALNVCSKKVVR